MQSLIKEYVLSCKALGARLDSVCDALNIADETVAATHLEALVKDGSLRVMEGSWESVFFHN